MLGITTARIWRKVISTFVKLRYMGINKTSLMFIRRQFSGRFRQI
jgi:hypothetical protein